MATMGDAQTAHSAEPSEGPMKAALTPPTSEEFNDKRHDSPDLTDLDLDSEEEEDIDPSYYYEGGKIPVFEPVSHSALLLATCASHANQHTTDNGTIQTL